MKNFVYETPVKSEEDLLARILAAAEIIEHAPGFVGRVYENMRRRYTVCNEQEGRLVEPHL